MRDHECNDALSIAAYGSPPTVDIWWYFRYKDRALELTKTEGELRQQLTLYADKFEQFQVRGP